MSSRQDRYVNSIGFHRQRSENILKKNKTEYGNKMKRMADMKWHNLDQVKSNFVQKRKEKANRMSNCKCWSQGTLSKPPTSKMFDNEEELEGNNEIKENPGFRNSLENSAVSFKEKKMLQFSRVKENQQMMLEQQRAKSEGRLRRQKEISDRIKLRK